MVVDNRRQIGGKLLFAVDVEFVNDFRVFAEDPAVRVEIGGVIKKRTGEIASRSAEFGAEDVFVFDDAFAVAKFNAVLFIVDWLDWHDSQIGILDGGFRMPLAKTEVSVFQ